MKTLKQFLKVRLTLLVLMLCSSITAFGEDNSVVVQIDGIFYRLYQQEMPTGTGYYAAVTYNPEINPWMSSNSNGMYEGDLVIPESVKYNDQDYPVRYCEDGTYVYAHSLTSISFPKTIINIPCNYLGDLNNLEAIIVDPENPYFTTINGVLYNKEVTDVLVIPCKRGGTYRVPATITEFGQSRIGKPILDELIIPATVTKIGNNIFNSNSQIKKVTIEDSDNELIVGIGNSWRDISGENGSINPLFYQCNIQEVYWGRNLKESSPPFAGNGSLTKVTFGPKVTSVPKYSFYDCYGINTVDLLGGLEQWMGFDFTKNYTNPLWNNPNGTVLFNGSTLEGNVDIPASVTSIPSHAFQYGCSAVTSLNFHANVSDIADGAFRGLPNLATISLAEGSSYFKVIDNVLYDYNVTKILCFPQLREGEYEMPSTITSAGDYQFYHCTGLTGITLSENLQSIGISAFEGCIKLPAITIPTSVTTIGDNAFNNCPSLTNVVIEDGTTPLTLGNRYYVIDHGGWTQTQESGLFSDAAVTNAYIGRNLIINGQSPFTSDLTTVTIGDKVNQFPENTFSGCYGINTVNLLGGLEQWMGFDFTKDYTCPLSNNPNATLLFNGSTLYGNVDIPASITSIPSHAFQYGCAAVTGLNFHANVSDIADDAFRELSNLATISLTEGSSYFKVIDNVLYDYNVTKILCFPQQREGEYEMPSTITSAGDYQFYHCTGLTGITLSENLQSIGISAFEGCIKLPAITIPTSVTTIGDNAFNNCPSLTNVVIEDGTTPLTLGNGYKVIQSGTYTYTNSGGQFYGAAVTNAYIGRNLIINRYSPFTSNLMTVTIGDKVNQFPEDTFKDCSGILNVYFNGSIIDWCNITFANQYATPFGNTMMAGNITPILHVKEGPLHSQVNVPSPATKIGAYAFFGQLGVSTVTIPATIQTIEPYAFSGIGEVYFEATSVVPLQNENSFSGNVYVPDDLLKSYRQASVWSQLSDRIYPLGFLQVTVDLVAMSSSPALLPALNALEKINGEYRIERLTNLKIRGTMNGYDILMVRTKMPNLRKLDLSEVTIVNNDNNYEYYTGYHTDLETITPYMFYNIKHLKEIILPANIKTIQSWAFAESGITSMVIPSIVKTIGDHAFRNCQNLVDLTLTKGLETIKNYAFYDCHKLRALVLPTSLKRIESHAFADCYGLTTIDFAEGLQYIGSYAFDYCGRLKELRMPTSLRQIESAAFRNCYGLTEVHVPSMITQIGDYAFTGCGLKAVYAYTLVPVQINQNTFDYDGVDLYAPDNSFYAYYINTQWSQFRDVIEFPAIYTSWYTPRNTDLTINVSTPIKSKDGADGSMEPGSGLIFVGDGEQLVKDLILNWQHGSNYPALIEDNNLNVEELKFIMNVYPGRWYFFSFPFDIDISDITFDGKYVWRYYDAETRAENGSGGWKNVTDGKLKANVGYIFQSNTEGDLELPVNNPIFTQSSTGQKEVPLETYPSTNAQDASWNFVGNPNLSYYDLDNLENSGFTAPITVWDEENQTYTAVVPGDDEYDFHPFQAYFVQAPENTDNLTFEDENRSTYVQTEKNAANRRRAHAARRVNENRLLVNLILTNGTTTDKTRVIFNDDNRMDYEAGRDANKFMSMNNVPQLYSLDAKNVKYAVNARPNGNREVRLGFVASAEGNYTIAADRMDCCMALKDNLTGQVHSFDKGDYEFYSEAGTFDSRFTLISGLDFTAINSKTIEGVGISTFDGGIVVNGATDGELKIYNVNGVKSASISGTGSAMLSAGTYIVSYNGKSSKVVIK